ncbi:threonine--tRNA ligase [Buchnera aphidicola (Nipponaphis monzeni)]|uniref:Threonine--tRNA ligase n=1 Tax=Buchnera aphidicola (Nipponaphis monzeni) TaxID=2495405 RepID=A0A455T9W0_9GAMM|nr:threonine--tRNA ligase [Buchnera aphidicola]BBI01114.1 threonine--tRNA ligase [Buchnera aphidicola (Nipponaphis monzeni)]
MPIVTLIDGTKKIFNDQISILEIAETIKSGLSKLCVAAEINGTLVDACTIINENCNLKIITNCTNDKFALEIIRCTCIQLFSYAIKTLWPNAKLANSKITDDGFYYDIEYELKKNDLHIIEKKMRELIKRKYLITRKIISYDKCKKIFKKSLEYYKYYILKNNNFNKKKILTIYYHNNHVDITNGIQTYNINFCKNFKVQRFSGVYWLGKLKNKTLQRIYVTVWDSNKKLNFFLKNIDDSLKRDHRKIAKTLDLYHIQEESPGMVFWHNHGLIIFQELQKFIRTKLGYYNYQEVKSPIMINKIMWEKSGHWSNYKDNIFVTSSEKRKYCIKPMNCPGHVQIFNQKLHSYKDLPIRIAEFGICHRNESSGSLHGLMRTRSFTQDDAHIFCTKDQVQKEINHCIQMTFDIYKTFGFKEINVKFSSRPKKRIGDDITWDTAENDLINVLNENKLKFTHQEGEGAFYGPKIELTLKDSLNRTWQCGTIQLDFYLPKRLQSFYIDKNNHRKIPIIIHRAILGSMERFIGILTEEYSGFFPLWLSPIQVGIINITEDQIDYVNLLYNKLIIYNIRIKKDTRIINMNIKIKTLVNYKVPYIIICGNDELKKSTITIRTRDNKILKNINISNFIEMILKENSIYALPKMEV